VATAVEIVSASAETTEAAGERLGATLGPGAVVALTGELGAGKTCFVQGLVRGLGASARATSPTFVLVNEYVGRVPIHHVDAYRTDTMTELIDKLTPLLPPDAIRVHIAGVGDEPRTITIRG
jgi:tRNA threonylcarbamoyladenosine biosynthesis protein TsaE